MGERKHINEILPKSRDNPVNILCLCVCVSKMCKWTQPFGVQTAGGHSRGPA